MRKLSGIREIYKSQDKRHQRPDTVEEGKNLKYFRQMWIHSKGRREGSRALRGPTDM